MITGVTAKQIHPCALDLSSSSTFFSFSWAFSLSSRVLGPLRSALMTLTKMARSVAHSPAPITVKSIGGGGGIFWIEKETVT